MIKPLTVFVVGAGASVPFGFPSGLDLLSEVKLQKPDRIRERTHEQVTGLELQLFCERLQDCQELSLDAMLEYQPENYQAAASD